MQIFDSLRTDGPQTRFPRSVLGLDRGEERNRDEFHPCQVLDSPLGASLLTSRKRPGNLWVVDHFQMPPSMGIPGALSVVEHQCLKDCHGTQVASIARQTVSHLPVVCVKGEREWWAEKHNFAWVQNWNQDRTPEALLQALKQRILTHRKSALESRTEVLRKMAEASVCQSVVNLSSGCGLAGTIAAFLGRTSYDPEDPEERKSALRERTLLGLALGLDVERLCCENPNVSRPEKARMFQKLVDLSVEGDSNPELIQAKRAYDQACAGLVANHNSIVVAAGNEQDLPAILSDYTGAELRLPPDFLLNDLTNSHTVAVGATQDSAPGSPMAEYSCRYPGVRFFASGQGPHGEGTSLAAPRIAAVLANIHRDHPDWDSSQCQDYLRQRYCIEQGDYQVLDERKLLPQPPVRLRALGRLPQG